MVTENSIKKIVDLAKEIFERKLNSNPNDFSFDDEHLERKLKVKSNNFHGTISKYEREQYYVLRISVYGYPIVISEHYNGNVSFYISDSNFGRVEKYDKKVIDNCLAIIYDGLTELLN